MILVGLAISLLATGVAHAVGLRELEQIVAAHGVAPAPRVIGVLLVGAELILGAGVVLARASSGDGVAFQVGALLVVLLHLIFAPYLLLVVRSNPELTAGCGCNILTKTSVGWASVIRATAVAMLAAASWIVVVISPAATLREVLVFVAAIAVAIAVQTCATGWELAEMGLRELRGEHALLSR